MREAASAPGMRRTSRRLCEVAPCRLKGGCLGGQGRNRTTDTRIFSPLLYRLSYLAMCEKVRPSVETATTARNKRATIADLHRFLLATGGQGPSKPTAPGALVAKK